MPLHYCRLLCLYGPLQHIVRNGNCVQNHISLILILILFYYTVYILKVTVLFDMCAVFALGALHNFQISSGGQLGARARAQGGSCHPCHPAGAAYDDDKLLCVTSLMTCAQFLIRCLFIPYIAHLRNSAKTTTFCSVDFVWQAYRRNDLFIG